LADGSPESAAHGTGAGWVVASATTDPMDVLIREVEVPMREISERIGKLLDELDALGVRP
jgi:hypothetical protein